MSRDLADQVKSATEQSGQPGACHLTSGDLARTIAFVPPEDYQLPNAALRLILALMHQQTDHHAFSEVS